MMDSNESIYKAISILRCSPNAEDIEVYDALVATGVKPQIAARVIEFLPMVYCRLILTSKGVKFANSFRRRLSDGGVSASKLLSSEPLWEACVAFANMEAKSGVSGKDLWIIAARSAEFHAVNQMLNGGSKLKDLILTSSVLMWPEHGPSPK